MLHLSSRHLISSSSFLAGVSLTMCLNAPVVVTPKGRCLGQKEGKTHFEGTFENLA